MSADQILSRLEHITARLEALEGKLGGGGGGGAPAGGAPAVQGEDSAAAKAWDDVVAGYFAPFSATTDKIGGDNLKAQVAQMAILNGEIRKAINTAAHSKQPPMDQFLAACQALSGAAKQVKELREKNRNDKQWEHLSTLSEVGAFSSWVAVSPTPGPFVKEALDASLFWSNKILKQYKGVNEDQVDWCNQLKDFMNEIQKYIKQYHTTGLTWNAHGKEFSGFAAGGAAAPKAGGPPPPGPPPPGPPPPAVVAAAPAKSSGGDPNALFAAINKGGAITSGLKKVTKDMQTHKNPELRAGGVVKSAAPKAEAAPKKFGAAAAKKQDPKGPVLDGNKWVIEYHEGNQNLTIPAAEIEAKHSIYIYRCERCTIQVPAKVNGIIIDGGKRLGIAFQDVISGCEVVNSQNVNMQSQGKIPNFAVDKSSSIQIILSKASLDAQIVTSKCDSVNIMFPQGDDHTELPVPEQFVTTVVGGKLVTKTLEHE